VGVPPIAISLSLGGGGVGVPPIAISLSLGGGGVGVPPISEGDRGTGASVPPLIEKLACHSLPTAAAATRRRLTLANTVNSANNTT
jgi:hypothetical protein